MTSDRDGVALRPEQATIPPGHSWNRLPTRRRPLRPAGRGGVRDSGTGQSEAVLLLVARLVPVLSEPGPRRALLRADSVRNSGRLGDRAATDWGNGLRHRPRAGGPLPAVLLGLHDLYAWTVPGAAEHDAPAAMEGATPQRAVLPDPGGALLRKLVPHRPVLLPRLERSGRDGDPAVSAACAASPGPPSSSSRLRRPSPRSIGSCRSRRIGTSTILASTSSRVPSSGSSRCSRSSHRRCAARGCSTRVVSAEHLQDVGKLLFGFTAFWAYIAFSQFFLIWYPEPAGRDGLLQAAARGVLEHDLADPDGGPLRDSVLLPDGPRRQAEGNDAGPRRRWLLAMHYVDLYWQVMPTLHPEGVRPSALDVAAFLAVGGCFVAAAGWLLRRQALVPLRDPRLGESLAFEHV